MRYEENEVLRKLPSHLKQYIRNQDYDKYTAQDQAVWRYVMRKNIQYLSQVAHEGYLNGLHQTGISIESIPDMYGMNRILKDIGWAAVAVDGFIPPAAFMEFQAYNVLVIAQDIRKIENLEYTPAPDIIHESAGHAPIIADREYAEYLRRFGEIGSKAISSALDHQMYEAVRHLSIVKEDRYSDLETIKKAEDNVLELQASTQEVSEMSRIRNLHWWTVEYGLIGTLTNPKIYGAGLLSSIGESKWCMSDVVKKLSYDISASEVSFDITRPQPQLYVTSSFAQLNAVLEEFAGSMGLRTGGASGIQKLIASQHLGTVEYNSGLQVSGIFARMIKNNFGHPIYIQTNGPTALSHHEKELIGHNTSYHAQGFGSPIGKLKNCSIPIEDMTSSDLEQYQIREGKKVLLEFENGVVVDGTVITGTRNNRGKIMIIAFRNCTVRWNNEILFHPDWGTYDMAVGSSIIAAYAGPADASSFDMITHQLETKSGLLQNDPTDKANQKLYHQVRKYRNHANNNPINLDKTIQTAIDQVSDEWLLLLELYELCIANKDLENQQKIKQQLQIIAIRQPDKSHLIEDGMQIAESANKAALQVFMAEGSK